MPPDPLIMAIDPSSVACGWALMRSETDLCDFGVIYPEFKDSPVARGLMLAERIAGIAVYHAPARVIIEIPDVHPAARTGRGAGLASYAMAVGMVIEALNSDAFNFYPETVRPIEWTKQKPKATRAAMIATLFPPYRNAYNLGDDKGFDAADAIGILLWWFGNKRKKRILEKATPA